MLYFSILMLPIVCPNHSLESTNNISKQFRESKVSTSSSYTIIIIIALLYDSFDVP